MHNKDKGEINGNHSGCACFDNHILSIVGALHSIHFIRICYFSYSDILVSDECCYRRFCKGAII